MLLAYSLPTAMSSPAHTVFGPPLGPGGGESVLLHDLRLPLQKPGKDLQDNPAYSGEWRRRGFQDTGTAALSVTARRRALAEILHQKQLVLQIRPLKGDGVFPEDGGVKEETAR